MGNNSQVLKINYLFREFKNLPSTLWQGLKRNKFIYITGIIFPLLLYIIFIGYPIIDTIVLSFKEWNGLDITRTPIGYENYRTLIHDPKFLLSLTNNIKWAVLTLIFPVVLGLLFAVFLHSGNVYFPSIFRAILFIPVTMSLVTVGVMFSFILNPIFGALNVALEGIGLASLIQDWLGDPKIVLYTLIFIFGWAYTGMPLMLFHAGISEIPEELFDAAKIEGASGWQTFWSVTLPLLKPVNIVVIMLTVINSIKAFDLVMVMTHGGPFNTTSVLGYFMYNETFWNYRFGYGASISVVILLLSSIFAVIYLRQIAGEAMYVS